MGKMRVLKKYWWFIKGVGRDIRYTLRWLIKEHWPVLIVIAIIFAVLIGLYIQQAFFAMP